MLHRYRALVEVWHTRKDVTDVWMVRKAFRLAADAHKDMRRRSGEPYIFHPLEVATIAAGEIGLGRTSIICALLHDVVEDTEYRLSDIEAMFGEQIARIIDGLTKIDDLVGETDIKSMQAENFRKVLLTLSYDVRVILVKLADRLHNMRTLDSMPPNKQLKIASETSYLYAPLANRLGLYAVKSELEDLSMKYIEPAVYQSIHRKMNDSREDREIRVNSFVSPVINALKKMDVKFRVLNRDKTAHSIWQRMKEKEIPFEEVYDTFVVRFVIDCPIELEKIECWRVYATITQFYRPNNDRLRDWISLPKANGYESLHATVMSNSGKWIEVQIRTEKMEEIAEKGYAAYWKYKDKPYSESGLDEWLSKVREILNTEEVSAIDFIDNFKLNLFSDEISVFTPKGKMISLPIGSTALDFAYNIHSSLGNSCIGANVNHKLVPLNYPLKSGDQVEIITSKVQQPKEEWFDFVVTARAKSGLKEGIRELRKTYKELGREKLEGWFKQLNIEPSKQNILHLIEIEEISGIVDLYFFAAIDRINLTKVRLAFKEKPGSGILRYLTNPFSRSKTKEEEHIPAEKKDSFFRPKVIDQQMDEMNYTVSTCCNPIPGDEVVALFFPNEPLHIHRTNCPKAQNLMSQYGNNIVKAKWRQKEDISFLAGIKMTGIDSVGFVHRLTQIISIDIGLNIRTMQLESSGGVVELVITVYVQNAQQLKDLIASLRKIKEIRKVSRLDRLGENETIN
ncbi:MAG: bifunctional (p)ppGpp synthetase/guanosine-3',5'-bis(diphosphate) 3'-pyrophosphohydrolase [Bacteroidales bacterium]|nr:bifunctional (p)ppGpp synthetase/guanosine-3',5'-bis(diphosphate) 3'-pyrophosphohydrolase [Bacteroidales bacterium]